MHLIYIQPCSKVLWSTSETAHGKSLYECVYVCVRVCMCVCVCVSLQALFPGLGVAKNVNTTVRFEASMRGGTLRTHTPCITHPLRAWHGHGLPRSMALS